MSARCQRRSISNVTTSMARTVHATGHDCGSRRHQGRGGGANEDTFIRSLATALRSRPTNTAAASRCCILHGAGGLLGFEPFLEELGKDFRVIAPHLPGFGESTGGELIDDVIDAALFYHQLMDDLGIRQREYHGPFDGRDARGGSRGARYPSGQAAGAGRCGRLLDRCASDSGCFRARP